jgi:hypothetical protein
VVFKTKSRGQDIYEVSCSPAVEIGNGSLQIIDGTQITLSKSSNNKWTIDSGNFGTYNLLWGQLINTVSETRRISIRYRVLFQEQNTDLNNFDSSEIEKDINTILKISLNKTKKDVREAKLGWPLKLVDMR